MQEAEAQRAVAAARTTAGALGLSVDDAQVLNDSNRLVVRLLPCDVVARVAPVTHFANAQLELDLVARLASTDAPVAPLDGRVEARLHVRDGFEISLWTPIEQTTEPLQPVAYAEGLARLHRGLRRIDGVNSPHVTARVESTERDVADRAVTPDLSDDDRALLADTLRTARRFIVGRHAPGQLLHGEPHRGNVLTTTDGPLFIDFENATRGPVEYDLGWVPDAVSSRYPDADHDLVGECRRLVHAIIAMHRWSHADQHPSGRVSGVAFLDVLRAGPPWPAIDEVRW